MRVGDVVISGGFKWVCAEAKESKKRSTYRMLCCTNLKGKGLEAFVSDDDGYMIFLLPAGRPFILIKPPLWRRA